MQVYRVYCRSLSDGYHNNSAVSNLFNSTRASISSYLSARRGSSVSVLSERIPSYHYGRQCSDSDASNTSSRRSTLTDFKRELFPIDEHNEEMLLSQYDLTNHLKNVTGAHELESSKVYTEEEGVKQPSESTKQNSIKFECMKTKVANANSDQDGDNKKDLPPTKSDEYRVSKKYRIKVTEI